MQSTSRSRVYRTEAVVLKGHDFGEADRILTVYTPHSGQLRVIAKGVRRGRSRKAGHLDLFIRSNILVARGRQLDIVTQAEGIENFQPIRTDIWRVSYAHYVAELVASFTVEGLANYPVYALIVSTLRRIATESHVEMAIRSFELQLLGMTGYRPQLQYCLECNEPIGPGNNHFSAKLGGVLCDLCANNDSAATPMGVNALKILRNLQSNEAAVMHLRNVPEQVQREVEKRLQEYIAFHLESRPRSLNFLERLRSEGVGPTPT